MRKYLLLSCMLATSGVFAQQAEIDFAFNNYHKYYNAQTKDANSEKSEALKKLRNYFHDNPYRLKPDGEKANRFLALLNENGTFSDMDATEKELERMTYIIKDMPIRLTTEPEYL